MPNVQSRAKCRNHNLDHSCLAYLTWPILGILRYFFKDPKVFIGHIIESIELIKAAL